MCCRVEGPSCSGSGLENIFKKSKHKVLTERSAELRASLAPCQATPRRSTLSRLQGKWSKGLSLHLQPPPSRLVPQCERSLLELLVILLYRLLPELGVDLQLQLQWRACGTGRSSGGRVSVSRQKRRTSRGTCTKIKSTLQGIPLRGRA